MVVSNKESKSSPYKNIGGKQTNKLTLIGRHLIKETPGVLTYVQQHQKVKV